MAVTSAPSGATIWTKEGKDYTCTNSVTPAVLQLTFHDQNDSKQFLVRKFGYSSQKLVVAATQDKVEAKLAAWDSGFFSPSRDDSERVRDLAARIKKPFLDMLVGDTDAFRCAPFEFRTIGVFDGDDGQLELGAAMTLGSSAVARQLRVARHTPDKVEQSRQMAKTVLDAGLAEMITRFGAVAAKFPEIKHVFVACTYATTEAALATELDPYFRTWDVEDNRPDGSKMTWHYTEKGTDKRTVVKDESVVRTLAIAVPVAKIPHTNDRKTITEAILSDAVIDDFAKE
jgi:hypothetical protein